MAEEFSFDIVSNVDMQAMDDAVNMANKEIFNRFDFKGSVSKIELDRKSLVINITSDDENKLKSVIDILRTRIAKRGIAQDAISLGEVEKAGGTVVRQEGKLMQGIPTDKAKEIVKLVKDSKIKVTPAIMGDHIRISSKSKDTLQEVIALVKGHSWGLPLQFANYR